MSMLPAEYADSAETNHPLAAPMVVIAFINQNITVGEVEARSDVRPFCERA
jgi:hypothetical protein